MTKKIQVETGIGTAVREALASAGGSQKPVTEKRKDWGRQQNRRHAPWERCNAPNRGVVMRR